MAKLRNLFNDPTLSDVKIRFGEHEVFAHKHVLVTNSTWFDKAILGGFSEAKQNVINLGDDDDPDAIFAMLKHFYNMNYANQSIGPSGEAGELQFRLKVYQTADFYDAPDLRAQAATRFYSCMSNSIARPARSDDIPEYVVLMIQEVLGPNAPVFPDDRLQDDIFHIVKTNTTKLHQNKLFLKLLAKGEMFNDQYGEMFAQQVGELLASATTRSSPARSVFSVSRGLTSQVPRI